MTPENGVFIETGRLRAFARTAAAGIETGKRIGSGGYLRELSRAVSDIRAAAEKAGAGADKFTPITGKAEWLLDNIFAAERCAFRVKDELRGAKYLPAGNKRIPAAAVLAGKLVGAGLGLVTPERAGLFLAGAQEARSLEEGELSLFLTFTAAETLFFLKDTWGLEGEEAALRMENVFNTLRFLESPQAGEAIRGAGITEKYFALDPTGEYGGMTEETKGRYREALAGLARKNGLTEAEAAGIVLGLAAEKREHLGRYIFTEPLGKRERGKTGALYIAANVIPAFLLSAAAARLSGSPATFFLALLPLSEITRRVLDALLIRLYRPRFVPEKELKYGVPEEAKTVCCQCVLSDGAEAVRVSAAEAEGFMLRNRDAGKNVLYAVLADFPEGKRETEKEDREIIAEAEKVFGALNEKYGGGFLFLYRRRKYSERDKIWRGRERKRGAILELSRLLSGEDSEILTAAGDEKSLEGAKFIIVLDGDTSLTAGAVKRLVGAAVHPLNRAVVDEEKGVVVSGHGIIRPRVEVSLKAAGKTDFARIAAGAGGLDSYGGAASDVYQDVFGLGSFTGKGIIDAKAYCRCLKDAFPDERILSHDILEGAYLRCCCKSDIVLTDGFPGRISSYFARLERWTRGDFQALPRAFPKVKDRTGEVRENPLSVLDRWKIADNVRRALVPTAELLCLLAAFFSPAGLTAGIIAGVSIFGGLLLSGAGEVFRRLRGRGEKYHTAVLYGVPGFVMRSFGRLALLPHEGCTTAFAGARAVWRMLISGKKLLDWVTAAGAEKRGRDGILSCFALLWLCVFFGAAALIFSPYPLGKAVGLLWLFTPVFARSVSRERKRKTGLKEKDKRELLAYAADIRRYFAEISAEDNYLPPDNRQEDPPTGTAHRTSPTNIGLGLLAAVAAFDLGLSSREETVREAGALLDAADRLEKLRGHLYNWYDTETLLPLRPLSVSSVDSGNLAACLTAAESAFREMGEMELASKCAGLAEDMDFSWLYDEKRRLFHISWDAGKGEFSGGYYDLLASEARLLSYFAVARGDVPPKHWKSLSRSMARQGGYKGLVSWTGTAFEYLMPDMLLPCPENSLLAESRAFCLYAQRKAAVNRPWGESESAFFAFDGGFNYSYKANGVQALALKRGMARDAVAAPYASFLALPAYPKAAVLNLRRLKKLGAYGKYGFCDALDFTPERAGEGCRPVKTYMAHHLGMSLVSIDNALNGGIMIRRFMAKPWTAAFSELLEERVPIRAPVARACDFAPEKPERYKESGFAVSGAPEEDEPPQACLISNGTVTGEFYGDGKNVLKWRDLLVSSGDGLCAAVISDGEVLPLTLKNGGKGECRFEYAFTGSSAGFSADTERLSAAVIVGVSPGKGGFSVKIKALGKSEGRADICLYLAPALARRADFNAHPAFCRLKMTAKEISGGMTVTRRDGGASVCLMGRPGDRVCSSRASAFGRGRIFEKAPFLEGKFLPASPEICALIAAEIKLRPGVWAEADFAVAVGDTPEEAERTAAGIISEKAGGGQSRLEGVARTLGMTAEDIKDALYSLSLMERMRQQSESRLAAIKYGRAGRERLWKFGVSGDLPIMAARLSGDGDIEKALEIIKKFVLLRENGYGFDLVFLVCDGADYYRRQKTAVTEALSALGFQGLLGQKGGVHTADSGDADSAAIIAASRLFLELSGEETSFFSEEENPSGEWKNPGSEPLSWGFRDDGAFSFAVRGRLPETAWQHVLTNGRLGYLATDAGTGFSWYENAREQRISPWENDGLSSKGREDIRVVRGNESASLFAGEDGFAAKVTFGFGFAVWEKDFGEFKTKLLIFIPPDEDVRVMKIDVSGDPGDFRLYYSLHLILGGGERGEGVAVAREGRRIIAENACPLDFPGSFVTETTEDFDMLSPEGECGQIKLSLPFASQTILSGVGFEGVNAEKAFDRTVSHWKKVAGAVRIKTPVKELDDYINGWAIYQTYACRYLARTSIYQSGGAWGFRDQLQDALNLCPFLPEVCREHILKAASVQYGEGDVAHWWHDTKRGRKGVRTRVTDDLLWLPYALCRYLEITGDRSILREKAAFLKSAPLSPEERERYESAATGEEATVLEHAERACRRALKRGVGDHGLCLIGTGDWNDGFGAVGEKGRGESVWLTWFLSDVLRKMAEVFKSLGRKEEAGRYLFEAEKLKKAAGEAWDGDRFLRGWYDGGKPLGSGKNRECRIDSIAQSFAVFAGADEKRVRTAALTAVRELYRDNVTALFSPPFDGKEESPGYVSHYAPGFRENGGQYTHAAAWLAMALIRVGEPEKGLCVLKSCLPGGREEEIYKTEPYAVAADVYTGEGQFGRGGWSLYTGAAGWILRGAVEELLGIRIVGGRLTVNPPIPGAVESFEAEILGKRITAAGGKITITEKNEFTNN